MSALLTGQPAGQPSGAMAPTGSTPLRDERDIVQARAIVRSLSVALKFSLVEQTKMITAASELARNTVVYGGGGDMRWEVIGDATRKGLRLHFEDKGPGIPDVEQALVDGWTTGGGLGMGLSGSKRLVNEFAIRTNVGEGTCVSITRWK
ncbi:ATP-binding protein [Cupriavidus plantarum]|uniref:Serine/threonine-protein kinase RsbT n=1 Tax=Cupriavidus plantarum TaxID=942865 RepID=A0A316EXM4_9BURK|nr:serine/threonine-protein kinase RsbT [Cupriavidus plantarum]PWK37477.1 serine/threonine-protein kinase RsbT [Cupriavidus plantarum]REF01778.1 serine/threonine-protein kinase RsbT [Cupriavidus plantarum]RLK45361.1 serine/threonine-protein kinase RsbT [Cupriavidus plantarum]CAG2128286.1 Serine/threonine-protein kinase RsbT [Cupriavidus plantarum]